MYVLLLERSISHFIKKVCMRAEGPDAAVPQRLPFVRLAEVCAHFERRRTGNLTAGVPENWADAVRLANLPDAAEPRDAIHASLFYCTVFADNDRHSLQKKCRVQLVEQMLELRDIIECPPVCTVPAAVVRVHGDCEGRRCVVVHGKNDMRICICRILRHDETLVAAHDNVRPVAACNK